MEVGSGITGARDVGAGQLLYATAKFIVDHSGVKGVIRSCVHFRSNKQILKRVGIGWSEDAGDEFYFREFVGFSTGWVFLSRDAKKPRHCLLPGLWVFRF